MSPLSSSNPAANGSALSAAPSAPAAPSSAARAPPVDTRASFERHRGRWALGLGALTACCTGLVAWQASRGAAAPDPFGSRWLREAPVVPIEAEAILADLRAARALPGSLTMAARAGGSPQATGPDDPLAALLQPHTQAAPAQAVPLAASPAHQRATRPLRRAAPRNSASNSSTDPYAAQFGAPEQYRAGNALHVAAAPAGAEEAGNAPADGTLLAARLQTEVASLPSGGPVIALLQRPARLLGSLWPRGTQVHGTCTGSGNSDTRLFVNFEVLRSPSGRTGALRGVAVDLQGRHGIAGRKSLSHRSAGSVGLAAASSAARTLGRTLAGSVGAVLGSGIEGAAESGQSKAQRLDQDEYVVIAARGTPLQIYVTSAAKGQQIH